MKNSSDSEQTNTKNDRKVISRSKNESTDLNGKKLVSEKTVFDDGSYIIEEHIFENGTLIPSRKVEYIPPGNKTVSPNAELQFNPQNTKDISPPPKTLHGEKNTTALDDRIASKVGKNTTNVKPEIVTKSGAVPTLDDRIASKVGKNTTNAKPEVVTNSAAVTTLDDRIASKMGQNATTAKPEIVTNSATQTTLDDRVISKVGQNATTEKPEIVTNSRAATAHDDHIASKVRKNETNAKPEIVTNSGAVSALDDIIAPNVRKNETTVDLEIITNSSTSTDVDNHSAYRDEIRQPNEVYAVETSNDLSHDNNIISMEETLPQVDPEQPSTTNEHTIHETVEAYLVTEIQATAVEIEREEKKYFCCSESVFKTKRGTFKKRCWVILVTLIVCCVTFGIVFPITTKPKAIQPSPPTTTPPSHPSNIPSNNPSNTPSSSSYPSHYPSSYPSKLPSTYPSNLPSIHPSYLVPEFLQKGQDIDGEAAIDGSGYSVSLSSDGMAVAIGAIENYGINGVKSGHVRVYEYSDGSWVQKGQDIDGEAAYDYFGRSVSLSSDGMTVAIGADSNFGINGAYSGHVQVYEYSDGSWVQKGQDIDGESASDHSGRSVSLSSDGTTVAIGAMWNDGINGIDSGHVRVYGYLLGLWVQVGQDIDGEAAGDGSGYSVSLSSDGTTVATSSVANDGINGAYSGHVRVYEYSNGSWVQKGQDIDGEAANDYSGWSVSLSSDGMTVAIGANGNYGINGVNSGHVRVYEYSDGSWVQKGQDIDGEAAGDGSGYSVSLSSDGMTLAISAHSNDGINGIDSGHVRVYKYSNISWVQVGQDIDGEAAYYNSGRSVSLSSDGMTVAIGAFKYNDDSLNSGNVRVYQLEFVGYRQ